MTVVILGDSFLRRFKNFLAREAEGESINVAGLMELIAVPVKGAVEYLH